MRVSHSKIPGRLSECKGSVRTVYKEFIDMLTGMIELGYVTGLEEVRNAYRI